MNISKKMRFVLALGLAVVTTSNQVVGIGWSIYCTKLEEIAFKFASKLDQLGLFTAIDVEPSSCKNFVYTTKVLDILPLLIKLKFDVTSEQQQKIDDFFNNNPDLKDNLIQYAKDLKTKLTQLKTKAITGELTEADFNDLWALVGKALGIIKQLNNLIA
ncbi:hypothetical protein K2X40_01420 [Candidatus Babeliales bacterium]|nr:hypothetical protein [Candidatus Babeliales bacterium]